MNGPGFKPRKSGWVVGAGMLIVTRLECSNKEFRFTVFKLTCQGPNSKYFRFGRPRGKTDDIIQ
jgi:hypothetical protein